MLTIFVVSDSTGRTVERVARSALVQFPDAPVSLRRRGRVCAPQQIRAVVGEAVAAGKSLILHTLVSDDLRRLMLAEARLRGVDSLDLLGPMLDRLATHLKLAPQEKPGLLDQLVDARAREIEAVEFAFRHDDGQNADDLDRAEVVLVGVSRSMKTPTMLYLAYRGWLAANVPLIAGLPLPPALLRVDARRVFCLQMSPQRLLRLRRARASYEAIPLESYAAPAQLRKELSYARQLCRRHRWRVLDVTARSVEEVGLEIIALAARKDAHTKSGDI